VDNRSHVPPARLIALHEDVQDREYTLRDDAYTLGRSATCHIVVRRSVASRLHAKIEREGPRYVNSDSQSANGTYVNSHQLHEPHLLKNDDLIGLGGPAALLRFVDPDPTSMVAPKGLTYDEQAMRFSLSGHGLELPPGQFRLLRHLYQHAGTVCTREGCAQAIWGREFEPGLDSEALDRSVSTLRGALRRYASEELIETRRGLGYVLNL
jgi:hypothetical protein